MRQYQARLTCAGFLGQVTTSFQGATLEISGLRARRWLMYVRLVGQLSLGIGGFVGLAYGWSWALALVGSAFVYSFVLYLALWWTATEATSLVTLGPRTRAKTGWSFRWFHVVLLFNLLTILILLLKALFSDSKTVSFDGPSTRPGGVCVRYILETKTPADAAMLVAALLGGVAGGLDERGLGG